MWNAFLCGLVRGVAVFSNKLPPSPYETEVKSASFVDLWDSCLWRALDEAGFARDGTEEGAELEILRSMPCQQRRKMLDRRCELVDAELALVNRAGTVLVLTQIMTQLLYAGLAAWIAYRGFLFAKDDATSAAMLCVLAAYGMVIGSRFVGRHLWKSWRASVGAQEVCFVE